MKQLDHYLETAIKNIQDDREVTRELLDDVMRYLSKDEERHTQVERVVGRRRSGVRLTTVQDLHRAPGRRDYDGAGDRRAQVLGIGDRVGDSLGRGR